MYITYILYNLLRIRGYFTFYQQKFHRDQETRAAGYFWQKSETALAASCLVDFCGDIIDGDKNRDIYIYTYI